jgi:hypothetical protein
MSMGILKSYLRLQQTKGMGFLKSLHGRKKQ